MTPLVLTRLLCGCVRGLQGSSAAIPFGTMFAVLVLWFGVSLPLVFLGAYFGFKKEEVKHPVRVNQIPRQIPPQPWYLNPIPSVMVGGVLPFGAVFIELFFIMSNIWLAQVCATLAEGPLLVAVHRRCRVACVWCRQGCLVLPSRVARQVYYVFGFLMLVVVILVITCAEISIVLCYFQLCAEDYNWWWRSFLTSGSSAVYLFGYGILYFITKVLLTGWSFAHDSFPTRRAGCCAALSTGRHGSGGSVDTDDCCAPCVACL